jgi:hypothetical protein
MEERVRKHTTTGVNERIDEKIKESIARYLPQGRPLFRKE